MATPYNRCKAIIGALKNDADVSDVLALEVIAACTRDTEGVQLDHNLAFLQALRRWVHRHLAAARSVDGHIAVNDAADTSVSTDLSEAH